MEIESKSKIVIIGDGTYGKRCPLFSFFSEHAPEVFDPNNEAKIREELKEKIKIKLKESRERSKASFNKVQSPESYDTLSWKNQSSGMFSSTIGNEYPYSSANIPVPGTTMLTNNEVKQIAKENSQMKKKSFETAFQLYFLFLLAITIHNMYEVLSIFHTLHYAPRYEERKRQEKRNRKEQKIVDGSPLVNWINMELIEQNVLTPSHVTGLNCNINFLI